MDQWAAFCDEHNPQLPSSKELAETDSRSSSLGNTLPNPNLAGFGSAAGWLHLIALGVCFYIIRTLALRYWGF
jgi:hypothetical protein